MNPLNFKYFMKTVLDTFLKMLYLRSVLSVIFRNSEVKVCLWVAAQTVWATLSLLSATGEKAKTMFIWCRLQRLWLALGCCVTGFPFLSFPSDLPFWFLVSRTCRLGEFLCAFLHSRSTFCHQWADYHEFSALILALLLTTVLSINIITLTFYYCDNKIS